MAAAADDDDDDSPPDPMGVPMGVPMDDSDFGLLPEIPDADFASDNIVRSAEKAAAVIVGPELCPMCGHACTGDDIAEFSYR